MRNRFGIYFLILWSALFSLGCQENPKHFEVFLAKTEEILWEVHKILEEEILYYSEKKATRICNRTERIAFGFVEYSTYGAIKNG